jgi:hypothetical protein
MQKENTALLFSLASILEKNHSEEKVRITDEAPKNSTFHQI